MADSGNPNQLTERFLSLYNVEQRRIYALIRAMLFNRNEAEDVFQETCLALWKGFGDFEPDSNFSAWAAQVARNRVLAHCKKRGADLLTFGEYSLSLIAQDVAARACLLDSRQFALAQCIEKMSENDRELLHRRYDVGVTTVKLAAEMGRPLNTLYKSLQRIRRNLLECIDRTLRSEGASQ